jgi:hypothetical protein
MVYFLYNWAMQKATPPPTLLKVAVIAFDARILGRGHYFACSLSINAENKTREFESAVTLDE